MKRTYGLVVLCLALVVVPGSVGCPATARASRTATASPPVVKGNTAFALDLYAELRSGEGNLFFSPLSISTALAMTYAGARGDTAKEMGTVLHIPAQDKNVHGSFGALVRQLNDLNGTGGCEVSIANALWGQRGYRFLREFTNLVSDNYDAGMREVDFAASEAARRTINDWVAQETRDKIQDLIPPGVLDAMTRLVLTNAIYFKGNWVEQFDKKLTKGAPFLCGSGTKVPVPMMHKTAHFGYLAGKGFQALELPYKGEALSMVVFLPEKADGLSAFERSLTPANLDGWLKSLRKREVSVYLPRFKTTVRFELRPTLARMGMPLAFSNAADFSGMDGTHDLFISNVIHKAFVDVNEEGTEAAAATAVVMALKGISEPPPVFRADHPFVFLIRDRKSGSILFLGRVVNPKR